MAKAVKKTAVPKPISKKVPSSKKRPAKKAISKKAIAKRNVPKKAALNKATVTGMSSILQIEKFEEIFNGFKHWHINDFIKQINKRNNKGGVLPFVRGLRLSAQLIYAIREILESEDLNLEANWGHILDDDGSFCSRECDIIIHKKGAFRKWNGNKKDSIMDFRFIEKKKAIVVISCKSFVTATVINGEKNYCKEMKKYVKRVWFFGECCEPNSIMSFKKKSKAIGFNKCWMAYVWNRKNDETGLKYEDWDSFTKEIKKLK